MARLPESYYRGRVNSLNGTELGIFNRYYLHPKDQRLCRTCRKIFDKIADNFHIKKYAQNANKTKPSKTYTCWHYECNECQSKRNLQRRLEYRKNYKLFITKQMTAYKYRSKELKLHTDLDAEYLITLFETQNFKCFYTDIPISFEYITESRNRPHNLTPSLDRLNPILGYIKDNVVWCAYFVNRMKNDLSYEEFIDTCKTIINNKSP